MRYKNPDIKDLDTSKVHFKYIVSYEHATKQFCVDTMPSWKFHSDGHIPTGFKVISAGWVSCPKAEFCEDNLANAETWGGSEGFQVYPNKRDLAMLKLHFTDGDHVFTFDGDEPKALS